MSNGDTDWSVLNVTFSGKSIMEKFDTFLNEVTAKVIILLAKKHFRNK